MGLGWEVHRELKVKLSYHPYEVTFVGISNHVYLNGAPHHAKGRSSDGSYRIAYFGHSSERFAPDMLAAFNVVPSSWT